MMFGGQRVVCDNGHMKTGVHYQLLMGIRSCLSGKRKAIYLRMLLRHLVLVLLRNHQWSTPMVLQRQIDPRVRKTTEVFGSMERKPLANITNMQQPRMSMLDEKSQFIPASTNEYIEKLKKENMTLMKLMADRNKFVESSGNELHKLRVSVQKLQQQNLQLAQLNSQMLAELTVNKDRLKLMQHELGCKNGLLVAKGLELKEKDETLPSQKVDEEVKMNNEKLDSSRPSGDNVKPINVNRRQLSKSLGQSTVKESKDMKADNKSSQIMLHIKTPKTGRARIELKKIAPLMEEEFGFTAKDEATFLDILMMFGFGEFDWAEFTPRLKQNTFEEIDAYVVSFS